MEVIIMTSSSNFRGETFIEKVTLKQFLKVMMLVVFYFNNSYRLQIDRQIIDEMFIIFKIGAYISQNRYL